MCLERINYLTHGDSGRDQVQEQLLNELSRGRGAGELPISWAQRYSSTEAERGTVAEWYSGIPRRRSRQNFFPKRPLTSEYYLSFLQ